MKKKLIETITEKASAFPIYDYAEEQIEELADEILELLKTNEQARCENCTPQLDGNVQEYVNGRGVGVKFDNRKVTHRPTGYTIEAPGTCGDIDCQFCREIEWKNKIQSLGDEVV